MKMTSDNPETQKAFNAINRAAQKVLSKAVSENRPIPLWDGEKVVWKIPREEAEQMAVAASLHNSAEP